MNPTGFEVHYFDGQTRREAVLGVVPSNYPNAALTGRVILYQRVLRQSGVLRSGEIAVDAEMWEMARERSAVALVTYISDERKLIVARLFV